MEGHEWSTFCIIGDDKKLEGKLIFRKTKEAFNIYTNDEGEVFLNPEKIDDVLCVDYLPRTDEEVKMDENTNKKLPSSTTSMVIPILNSSPGAVGTLYLDFDGEYVSGGYWGTINAAPSNFTPEQITQIWLNVAEDFRPLNINVTTERAMFDAAPVSQRTMCIQTPTRYFSPNSSGSAYIGYYGKANGNPCWSFDGIPIAIISHAHELGHTLGLHHDGGPGTAYYGGHANWAPTMGNGYQKSVLTWAVPDYPGANNGEDDVAVMALKAPRRADIVGDTTTTASPLVINGTGTGNVSDTMNFGDIGTRTDRDVFSFTTIGGAVTFLVRSENEGGLAGSKAPNLDIQIRLLDATGTEIVKVDSAGLPAVPVGISQNLTAGVYYLEVAGVGFATPFTGGYSDYGSLGRYYISGTVPSATATGVNDAENKYAINIFPNPSSGIFTINIPNMAANSQIEVINSLGQIAISSSEITSRNIHQNIDLSNYETGIYCVVVRSGSEVRQGKVILK